MPGSRLFWVSGLGSGLEMPPWKTNIATQQSSEIRWAISAHASQSERAGRPVTHSQSILPRQSTSKSSRPRPEVVILGPPLPTGLWPMVATGGGHGLLGIPKPAAWYLLDVRAITNEKFNRITYKSNLTIN